MVKKNYCVTCTQIRNGYLHVQAESEKEACAIAQERLNEVEFELGEQSADYAEEED